MAGLRRRRDDLGVVAVRKHRAPPPRPGPVLADRSIEVLGRRDLEALHPLSQRRLVVGLHQQVDVRALDAEMDDAEVLAQRGRERGFTDRVIHASPPQVAHRADDAQRDMHRIPRVQERPLLVR